MAGLLVHPYKETTTICFLCSRLSCTISSGCDTFKCLSSQISSLAWSKSTRPNLVQLLLLIMVLIIMHLLNITRTRWYWWLTQRKGILVKVARWRNKQWLCKMSTNFQRIQGQLWLVLLTVTLNTMNWCDKHPKVIRRAIRKCWVPKPLQRKQQILTRLLSLIRTHSKTVTQTRPNSTR